MSGDKFDQLYNALKADGAVSGTREHFRQFVYAPGKQGYHNRKQLYDALYADGAVSSKSYEEFAQRLGLHAVNPKPQQQKPLTMKQRAQKVAAQYQQTKPQQPKYQQTKPQQPSTATASGTDYMKNWQLMHMRNDQMNPMQQAQANNARARMQRAQEQSARQEQQRATPISRSRITPTAKNFNETMQQLSTPEAKQARAKQQREDDARTLAQYEVEGNNFTNNDGKYGTIAPEIDSLVATSMKEADDLSWSQYQQALKKAGNDAYLRNKAWKDLQDNRIKNRQNVLADTLSSKLQEIYSQKGLQEHIMQSADKLNMGVEEYVDKYVTPHMMQRAQNILGVKNIEEILPQSATEYVVRKLSDSILGTLSAGQDKSREQIAREQEAMAIADGLEEMPTVNGYKANEGYKSGMGARFVSTAANMAMDSPILGMTGSASNLTVDLGKQVLMKGLAKAGVMKMGAKLTAQQLAFKAANMTMAQKIASGLVEGTAKSALNLGGYSSITAALGQASTGDDTSLSALGQAALGGFEHGATTGAMFGVSGAIMAPWVSKFGITGLEKSTSEKWLHGTQKLGATAAGLGVEAGTMMVADNITGDKDISFGTWLEDVVMVGAFKAGEPKNYAHIGNALYNLTHNSGGNFVIGRNANGSPIAVDIRLTPDEKNELISSASGKNLMDAFVDIDAKSKSVRDKKGNLTLDKHIAESLYKDFMADPEVSQSTKEKVNAAMGLFNTTRGKSYRSVNDVKNKQILEYTKDGTLLTRTSYKNADERRAILYKQKLYRDNDDMLSLIGYSKMKDMQLTDEDGNVTRLALGFLRDNGYDTSKDVTDPINAQLINDLRNPKSALYLDWEKYVDKNGSYGYLKSGTSQVVGGFMNSLKEFFNDKGQMIVDIDKIMQKDPMKRTDEENRIFYGVKRALEDELFPSGRPHEDQSASQGKTVAEEHSLGTDNPDSGVVVDELRNLRNAEQELDAAMDGNDVFKQVFEKLHQQGLTPAQIYDALIQNGLIQEELTPLAQYINANARVQGMQQATADVIEENVKSFVSDCSYHGTLNGQAMNGEQALYVQDSNGRTLLVGSGDVAFDQTTGKAKEGSGDMLVCFDPNTKEMVYVKADEVTLFQNQPIDQFAAEYRQRLQIKNSEPYNQAAQEQAMQDAAKAQQEQNAPQDNTAKSKDSTTSGENSTTSGEDNTTNENLVPQEQPQPTRKFADGTEVPMTTDSKGRPTPDYGKMTPEQSAEILTEDFGENAEKVVDGQIQKAEKALKDAEKMKVDYTAEPNDIMEQEALKTKTVEAAKKQLDHAQNIKKTMTAKKVAETVGNTEKVEGAHEAGSVAAQKFVNAPRLVGNKRTRMLPDGETKIKGHYEIVPAESLTPSHDVNNGYKKSDGFPTDAEDRTVNDRDYEHDKAAQQNTDQIARKYNGMAIEQVPVVSDEGIVYDGNGRTMAGQKAAKEGTDSEYINDLLENAENFGFTREQIEQSGIEHPRLVLVTDERLPYDTATFSKFNRNEKKTQSNTEQAVAKAKTLTSDEVGAIVAEIEGNGSLDAFFNNSKAINDLIKTLVDKGIIGQNEVAQMMDSPERLSAQGREYVKNLLLGSIFKPETIRMLGIDSTVKNKAINAIRSVMDNMKLGEFSLRDEIDQAIQLLYEARQGGNKVDTLLRTPSMFGEDAAKRYPSISQMMALALEGKVSDFRDLLDEYNRIAAARNTGEGDVFGEAPTKPELIKEFMDFKKWQDYGTGHSENEGSHDVSGVEKPQQEASGGNEPAEAERPRVEEPDDLVNKELESRIEVTDEETETPSKNGPIMKQKIVIDGDKEVMKVDEPNKKGEYTGSYYEYDGKKFGDLNEVTEYIDSKNEEGPLPLLPKEENPDPQFNPIEAAAAEFKKEHPLTEDEIMGVKDLDDESKYTAIDYLNGEDDSEIARICYEQAYNKAKGKKLPKVSRDGIIIDDEVQSHDWSQYKKGDIFEYNGFKFQFKFVVRDEDGIVTGVAVQHLDENEKSIEHGGDSLPPHMFIQGFTKDTTKVEKPKTVEQKKADNKKFKEERDKETADLMSQFLAAANDRKDDGSGKALSTIVPIPSKALKWMDRHLTLTDKQKEILPKLLTAIKGSMYARIKEGVYNLEDVVERVRKDFDAFFGRIDKNDANKILAEAAYKGRYTDPETGERMKLSEFAERERKNTPKHQENLVGDSKSAEERKMAEKKFIDTVNIKLGFKHKFNGIVELRKIAERVGLKDIKDTDLQELAETAIVKRARGIASSESTNDAVKFERIKTLYENQPSLNQRDSERVMKQQYSTPAPYAFLADMYVKGNGKVIESALEPSAGNGMLTIGLPMDKVHVNDIDAQRLANLRRQGFKNVTSQDGTQPFTDKDVDVVVTNPPFGSATPKEYDGYKISSLEGQMAINALESMKDDGRAAIIIGGKTEYAKNGSLNPKDKAFLGYLYSHYNVEDVINVDGGLYAKQGTSYPTRIILINGRRLNENAFPPVKDKARAEAVKDYDELYKRIEDDILRSERMDSSIGGEGGSINTEPDKQGSADTHEEGVRARERGGSEPDGKRGSDVSDASSVSGTHDDLENQRGTEPREDGRLSDGDTGADGTGAEPSQSEGTTAGTNGQRGAGSGGTGRNNAQPSADEPASTGSGSGPRGQLQRVDKSVRGLSTEKVTYTPKSGNPFTLKAVMPADQQEAVNKNLEKLGDADQFLVDELGYNDKDDLYSHLAAEQVDSVALALQQAKKGNAFIIGDMTGIGKGRQAASLIRYAKKQGQVPVYFTKTAGLLSDVYRDLVDIGSPDLRPFVFGSAKEAAITDSDGNVVFALPSKSEVKRVLDYIEKNGKLPDEYDYVLTTYSQVSNGVYEFDENGARKEKKLAKGKTFGAAALSGQKRRDAIEKLMDNAYLILDESHTAGGNSGQGNYFQHIIQKAKNVTFFSATFAKRPDNMPIYALRTAMNEGGMKSSDLIDAVKRGGATLQEIMSQTLTQCGQMIRRERDMTGVTIDWKAIDDPERVQEQREQYDSIIGLFNDIINFQKKYVSSYVDERNDELAAIQSTIGIKKGTAALGIKNQPFASKAFNTVQQVLLSLKAKSAAERAIDYLKQGMKPVIALNNTNESQTGNLALGEEMDAPDLGTSLKKGLEGTLRYTKKDAKDNSESGYIKLSDLGDEAVEAYHELEKKIEQTSTGLSLSPIDVIKNELQKAGYKVGELTGRQTEFVYNDNGTVTKVKRADTDKKKLARDFNDGKIDALILNKSAATGISLHASSKYKDQRKRVMIVAQQQLDVNDEVQMRGRIDRTGQVLRGAYEYVVSLIPAEQRLLMMFKAKLKSLDANTTSSQKSKFNEMDVADITNKYGDKVVREYMAEHLDLYSRMADPFGWENSYGDDLSRIDPQSLVASGGSVGDGEAGADASKLLGRMALLRVSEQEKMLQEIGELYANEIQRLNEMGENDLEITELPLKAKTIRKEVWKQGSEPGGDNAFADNTYIEKVNMAILKKPMKAAEVKASQEGLTGGKTWEEYKTEKKAAVKEYFDKKIADETQKYEERAVKAATKAKEKYIKDGKKGQDKSGMTDEQIVKNAGFQYDTIYNQEKDKLNDVIKNLNAKAEMFNRVLDTFDTNNAFVLPTDMNKPNELSGFGNSYGRLIDIKITDNFSPNASTVSFATLDGRRKITFPIAGKVGAGDNKADVISAIDNMTKRAAGMEDKHIKVLNQDFDSWDRLTSNESRKDGYIVTGNLMQALVDSKDQGLGGQLVKYTTDTGEVKTGILMPDRFDPKGLTTDAPINSVAEKFELSSWHGGIDEVTSSDGEVKVKRIDNNRGNYYEIRVPKSKAKGGKYFADKELLEMVDGHNFETRGNNMLAEFKPEQLKPVLDRLSKMGVKKSEQIMEALEKGLTIDNTVLSNDGAKFRTDRGENNYPTSSVESYVENVAKKVGAKVQMVSSVDEITNKAAKAAIEEGRKITGWYDEKTGEVHLYMPNIHDRYTAEKTIWHEVVGHNGMRELFGEDRFEKFLRDVWYDLDKPENAALKKLVDEERKFNPLNIYDAIEEGIARLAEDGKGEAGFWNGIKNKVSDFLHEIGYRIAPNTKDVKYLLWLSKNLQKNPNDPYWNMRAEAVKYRLDHERMPAVVAHDGMFYGNDGKVYSMESLTKSEWDEATDGQIHFHTTPTAATALDRYHRSLDAHGYMATESYMDNMLSLKKLMNAIVPDKKIEDISSSENPYILQNVMQGAMSDAAKLFEINIMKPLEKSMAGILDAFDGKNSDEKIRNFNLYMITKHGLERNREFFVRDFLKQMRMDEQKKQDADFLENSYYSDKEYLDNELKAGNIDLKEYYRQLDESIRNHFDADFEAGEHDYSGMHAIQEVAKSSDPYDDAEAIQSVMDSEAKMESIKKGAVKDYWDKVNAATQYSVDSDYKNGIISKELHGHVSNMFNWYVPLRKYDEATAEDTYGYITEKGDPKSYIGSTIMRARGHKYLSETNILAQIGAMGNRAISNGGQNAIRQAFARFARNNSGNNLITETSVWYEKDPVVNIVYERYPDIPDGATADEINQIVSDFNKDMKMKESQGMAYKVYRRDKIGYKFQRAENKSQHIVDVMIAGKKHSFVINGNPRAAQALNGMLEHKVGTFGKPFSVISRYMAQTCTSYNPEFVMRNMIRDFEFASTNLLAKEGMAYTKTFEKYYAQVGLIEGIRNTNLSDLKKMTGFGLFSKYRNGTLDTSDKIQRYFKEFMENGGETGWVQVKNTKELTAEYKLHIKTERNKVRKVSKGIFDAIFKNLENVNEVAENLARFATYCASRDAGRSAVRSAYDAKEVSTNFNRHGSGSEIKSFKNGEMSGFDNARKQAYRFTSAWFRNTSMFFNAGIQSTNLLIKNFKNNKAGTIGYIMAGPMISGMAMALLNNFIIANEDEKDRKGVKDPYGELPDYIRRNNLCIYTGGGEFITIPLAIEERAFYGLGDLAAGLTFSKNISGQKNPALDAVGCISQLAPVTDYLGNASFGKHPVQETAKAVLPSATSPFLEWVFNSDWKGAPIHRENKFDEYQPSWMLAYQGTPEWLINMNKKVNAMTNDVAPGNENMLGNGFLDAVTDPSGLQHFYSSYLGGAATFMERLGGIFKNGKDTETKDIPFVRSLFYTPSEKTSLQRTKSKWYNYLDETEKMIANAKRLKSKNVPLDELVKNYGDYYKFKQSKGAEKMNVIETATKEMKKWKKLRDKSSDTESIKFANQNIDNIMMKAVDELDKLN